MIVNPHDYDREERRLSSWRGSRGKTGISQSSGLKKARRLTLIDLLLLAVMAALLVPWAVRKNALIKLGPYRASINHSVSESELVLILNISLAASENIQENGLVGWKILRETGDLVREEFDLPPKPGNSREFVISLESSASYQCILIAGPFQKTVDFSLAERKVDER